MKKLLLFPLAFALFLGCSSTQVSTAYKTETATDTAVTTAMNVWGAYVSANHPPVSEELQVKAAFEKVQAAELLVNSATIIAQQTVGQTNNSITEITTDSAALAQALVDLTNLLQQFGVK